MNILNAPPNKYGESKVWMSILNAGEGERSAQGTPDNEYIHWWNTTYSEFLTYIQKEQTRASYMNVSQCFFLRLVLMI